MRWKASWPGLRFPQGSKSGGHGDPHGVVRRALWDSCRVYAASEIKGCTGFRYVAYVVSHVGFVAQVL